MYLKYLASIVFLALTIPVVAQVDTAQSTYGTYFFEGDEVVFEFDSRAYEQAVHESNGAVIDFADLDILKVAVSGNFNNWSSKGWKMRRIDAYRFQVRKHLKDFKDAPNWQFKFLINGSYWVTPDPEQQKKGVLSIYDIKNPDAPTPVVSDTGNVQFSLKGHTLADHVILTGSFNNWDEEAIHMKPTGEGWVIHLTLTPGVYEYKFIVDGKWMEDPRNTEARLNQYSTLNSVLRVDAPVRFELEGFTNANQVIIAGSFNNWNTSALHMQRSETGWWTELPLTGGKHQYKFIVDGNWMTDPANPRTETDSEGNLNSVLFVH